jgi:ribonuclease Y
MKENLQEESEKLSRKILSTVIQRLASEHTTEHVTSTVAIPNEEMKGRIIGKEGRNIQHFEKTTGVDVIIDETPDAVTMSCFDPIRRHIAKVSLERLVADGRINANTIEDTVKKVQEEMNKEIREAGEEAAYEAGVPGLHSDVLKILGRLKFRTSYGQNVLRHSVEMAHIAGMLAAELGADVNVCKKAAIMHDIGKALDHDIPGAHHHISMDIARKYGMSEIVINAIGAHHDDIEPRSVEAIIVKAADAISGARPGARRDSFESYVKRLTELENIANGFEGVEKSYAIQAGREVRIIVKPDQIDDLGALKLAREIAKKVESDLQYPGMIKVNVIRETRAVEFAK